MASQVMPACNGRRREARMLDHALSGSSEKSISKAPVSAGMSSKRPNQVNPMLSQYQKPPIHSQSAESDSTTSAAQNCCNRSWANSLQGVSSIIALLVEDAA